MKACSSEKWQFLGSPPPNYPPPQISAVDVLPPPPSFLPPPSSFKTVHFDAHLTAEEAPEHIIPMEVTFFYFANPFRFFLFVENPNPIDLFVNNPNPIDFIL